MKFTVFFSSVELTGTGIWTVGKIENLHSSMCTVGLGWVIPSWAGAPLQVSQAPWSLGLHSVFTLLIHKGLLTDGTPLLCAGWCQPSSVKQSNLVRGSLLIVNVHNHLTEI